MKFIRAIWVLALAASIGIFVGSLPGYWVDANGIQPAAEIYPVLPGALWIAALLSLSCAALSLGLAVLLFLKKPSDRMALFLSFFLLLYGIVLVGPLETFLPFWFPALGDLALQVQGGLFVISLALILVFPNGQFAPRWTRWIAVIGILEIPIALLTVYDLNELYRVNSPRAQILYGALGVLLILALGVQVYRYRRLYGVLERQQSKWVLFGFVVSYLLLTVVSIPYLYWMSLPPGAPTPWWMGLGSIGWQISLSILPIAFTIAILHARLWDIDIIIRKTLTYALVVVLLAIIYFGSVILLQQAFASVTGQRSEVITVLSTLAIAALFVPLRNRVQALIDRRFYRKKYDAQQVLEDFAKTVRDETDLEKLTARLMQVVDETMQPKSVSVWLNQDGRRRMMDK